MSKALTKLKTKDDPPLAIYDAAKKQLAEAKAMDEAKDIRDKAVAMAAYAKQAKDFELRWYADAIRVRAERRLGQMMIEMRNAGQMAKGTRGHLKGKIKGNTKGQGTAKAIVVSGTVQNTAPVTLASQNIDENLAKRARFMADLSETKFNSGVRQLEKQASDAIATNSLKRIFGEPTTQKRQPLQDINVIIHQEQTFYSGLKESVHIDKLKDIVRFKEDANASHVRALKRELISLITLLQRYANQLEE